MSKRTTRVPPGRGDAGSPSRAVVAAVHRSAPNGRSLVTVISPIAVTPVYPVGLGKVFQVVNCFVKLTAIEFAPSPSRLEFLEVPGNFVEVLSLMTVETGALGGPIDVTHYAIYQG